MLTAACQEGRSVKTQSQLQSILPAALCLLQQKPKACVSQLVMLNQHVRDSQTGARNHYVLREFLAWGGCSQCSLGKPRFGGRF